MENDSDRFVPKVHPLSRAAEPEDPYILNASAVPGDPDVLIRALVHEYAWMGWDAGQIVALFRDPFYPMLHSLLEAYGEAGIRERIEALFTHAGVYRFRAVVEEAPDESTLEVVQIGNAIGEGHDHGHGL